MNETTKIYCCSPHLEFGRVGVCVLVVPDIQILPDGFVQLLVHLLFRVYQIICYIYGAM